MNNLSLAAIFLVSAVAGAQVKVSEIRIKTDPANATIRPFETAVLQVLIYGEPPDLEGKPKRVRLQRIAEFQVADREVVGYQNRSAIRGARTSRSTETSRRGCAGY